MDNARKNYVNIGRLFNGDIYALLDSTESDDQGDIENIMNDSGTEFKAEDESTISNNIIGKKSLVTKVVLYQFQKNQSTFCLSKTRMEPIRQVKMSRILLLPLNVLPISHLLQSINVLLITQMLLPLNVLPISHLLLPLNFLQISHLLIKKRPMLYPTRTTQTRKRAVSRKTKTK